MEETTQILVENFNIKDLKYEFGKQNLTEVTISSLKKILKELPFGKDVLIPPRIITDKLIIEKRGDDSYFFRNNYKTSYFMSDKETNWEKEFGYGFTLQELEDLFKKKEESSNLKKISLFIQSTLDRLWILYIFFNIFFFIGQLNQELNKQNLNIVYVIFLIWINIFCVYSIGYSIKKLVKLKKEPQRIKLEYSIPFINSFETVDVSEIIIVIGQFFLYGFTHIYGLNFFNLFLLVVVCILLVIPLLYYKNEFYFNSKSKDLVLQRLFSIIHNHLEGNEKQTYLQVSIVLKEKPLLSSEKIPKFFTLFSILLTFIPIISYLFVYS